MRRTSTRLAILAVATLTGATALPMTAHSAPTESAAVTAEDSPLVWHEECAAWVTRYGMTCGTLTAPLDYSNPDAGDVKLFLTKFPATKPDKKKGTIFINPGGPGAGGSQYTWFFSKIAGTEAAEQFDFIGIDPRGLGQSEPRFDCGPVKGPQVPFFPLESGDTVDITKANGIFQKACAAQGNEIANFMTTADLARDIDLTREALGEDTINFFGISYGTHVAATIANMFPEKIRTVAAVSALNPTEWSTGYGLDGYRDPGFMRIGSAHGAAAAWKQAISDCEEAGPEVCPSAATIREDWDLLHSKGRNTVFNFSGQQVRYDQLANLLVGSGYNPMGIRQGLDYIHQAGEFLRGTRTDGPAAGDLAKAVAEHAANPQIPGLGIPTELIADLAPELPVVKEFNAAREQARSGDNGGLLEALAWYIQPMLGVACGETRNPIDPTLVAAAQAKNSKIIPGEGDYRAWQASACVNWPFAGKNAYMGPYTKTPKTPMLIIQNELDTATPYKQGAKKLQEQQPGSRMVLIEKGYGHAPYLSSTCSAENLSKYFVNAEVPAADITCAPDKGLFDE